MCVLCRVLKTPSDRCLPLLLSNLYFAIGSLRKTGAYDFLQIGRVTSAWHLPIAPLPSTGFTDLDWNATVLHGCWWSDLRPSHLWSKHFTHWAISSACLWPCGRYLWTCTGLPPPKNQKPKPTTRRSCHACVSKQCFAFLFQPHTINQCPFHVCPFVVDYVV